jgi:hypothetical protein
MRPELTSRKAFARAGRLAKRSLNVQQWNVSFPIRDHEKAAGNQQLHWSSAA